MPFMPFVIGKTTWWADDLMKVAGKKLASLDDHFALKNINPKSKFFQVFILP